jgi:predicted nucleic acid-binding protein
MTVVIADTSPLNYLVLIGQVAVLRALYEKVLIPKVLAELTDPGSPADVSEWARTRPSWLEVKQTGARIADPTLLKLDPGERAAIALAQEEPEALLLVDDSAARLEATRRGIHSTGTLGVLRAAALHGLLDLKAGLQRLRSTNFRASESLVAEILAEYAERRSRSGQE